VKQVTMMARKQSDRDGMTGAIRRGAWRMVCPFQGEVFGWSHVEGKRLRAAIRGLVEEYGPALTTTSVSSSTGYEKNSSFSMHRHLCAQAAERVTSEGSLLPCLGKGYTTYAEVAAERPGGSCCHGE